MHKKERKSKSYGKFRDFEIRDVVNFFEGPIDATKTGRYDLVKWETDNNGKKYCFSIGQLNWNDDEELFEFKSCMLRYLAHGTEDLNKWLLKWCELKEYELLNGKKEKD